MSVLIFAAKHKSITATTLIKFIIIAFKVFILFDGSVKFATSLAVIFECKKEKILAVVDFKN